MLLPPDANGNLPHLLSNYSLPTPNIVSPTEYCKQSTCTLGNGEALASTDARSDHAVLDFLSAD